MKTLRMLFPVVAALALGACGGGEAEEVGGPTGSSSESLDSCFCPAVVGPPVCGKDGVTYDDACHAACAGVPVAYEGKCEKSCNCPALHDPVCGSDGVTYENSCHAACNGAEVVCGNPCDESFCTRP